jgi:hypothetical protein
VSQDRIKRLLAELKFNAFFKTSAKEHNGIPELNSAIRQVIDWDTLPRVSSTRLFQGIKKFLSDMREEGKLLYKVDQLYDTFVLKTENSEEETPDLRKQFETCIGLVAAQGLLRQFSFGDLVLLQPELLDAYASAMITSAKDDTDGLGYMPEVNAQTGNFKMPEDERIDDEEQERLLLISTVQDLIRHEIALRELDETGQNILVFPSQTTRTYPHKVPEPDSTTAVWEFEGAVLNIYTTLLVRLWHTGLFAEKDMYENVAFYATKEDEQYHLFMRDLGEGQAELLLFCQSRTDSSARMYIEEYIHVHLERRALPGRVRRRKVYACESCNAIMNPAHVEARRKRDKDTMPCPVCETTVSIGTGDERASARQSLLRQRWITKLDQEADQQRRTQTAISIVQGKEATGDYDVFICYNKRDREAVVRVGEMLKTHAILPWLDEWVLLPGDNWEDKIQAELEKFGAQEKPLAFFIGRHGTGDFQKTELTYARDKGMRIIPIILPDTPLHIQVPLSIYRKHRIDFRKPRPDPLQQLTKAVTGKETPDALDPSTSMD